MKKYISLLLVGIALLLQSACEKSEPVDIDVEAEILKEMEARQIPSVVACIVKDDQIVWEGTFGNADVAYAKPATRRTLYSLQSITKLFLSVNAMQLWERGMLDLEADINQYLPFEVRNPQFPDEKITPYMLLNQTSSLAWPVTEDYLPDFHHFYSDEDPPSLGEWLPEYILPGGEQYRTSVWKEYPPGAQWLYSNIGTSLLGLVIEQISGMDYRDFCRINILEPFEMYQTAYKLGSLDPEHLVTPYTHNNSPMPFFTCRHYPAGFLTSNIEDFSHFVIAFLNDGEYKGKRILQQSTIDKMLEVQNQVVGSSFLWRHYLDNLIGHRGGGTGFSSWVEWDKDGDTGLFLFSNKETEEIYFPDGRIYELVKYQSRSY